MTQTEVADELDWSQSKVNRIELGEVAVNKTDLSALLNLYGVQGEKAVAEMIEMARSARRQNFTEYRDLFAKEFLHYLEFEGLANRIKNYQPNVVPGPLQTEEYARAILQAVFMVDTLPLAEQRQTNDRIERIIRARMDRKKLLLEEADTVKAEFVLNEGAIRRAVGAESGRRDIMSDQVRHLQELAMEQNIDVRILLSSAGAHPGMLGGFVVLDLPEPYGDSLLYLENSAGELSTRDQPDKINRFTSVFDHLRTRAVSLADLDVNDATRTSN